MVSMAFTAVTEREPVFTTLAKVNICMFFAGVLDGKMCLTGRSDKVA
jgi:hypothetical protein